LSSRAGAADVLGALGVNIDCEMPLIEESIRDAGIGFMMAPRHHSATRHVAGPRVELATRTIFNILGPLSNPAGVNSLLVGVYAREWVEPMAKVLGKLGAKKAWVIHGSDGIDELTTTGPSYVSAYEKGRITNFEVSPSDAGIPIANALELKGGDAKENAKAMRKMLAGQKGAFRDIVIYTAAAALIVADEASDLKEAAAIAADAIDTGKAQKALENMVLITNKHNSTSAR
jgi:anthranilate phosphoribosyltransferase